MLIGANFSFQDLADSNIFITFSKMYSPMAVVPLRKVEYPRGKKWIIEDLIAITVSIAGAILSVVYQNFSFMSYGMVFAVIGKALPSLVLNSQKKSKGSESWRETIEDWLLLGFAAAGLLASILYNEPQWAVTGVTVGMLGKAAPWRWKRQSMKKEKLEDVISVAIVGAGIGYYFYQSLILQDPDIRPVTLSLATISGKAIPSLIPELQLGTGAISAISIGVVMVIGVVIGSGATHCNLISNLSDQFTLAQNSNGGTAPLMVGFYLKGANIAQIKTWDFGDGKLIPNTYDLLENHQYFLRQSNDSSDTFNFQVTVCDDSKMGYGIKKTSVTVSPLTNTDHPFILNFDQTAGVIQQGHDDGFDVSIRHPITPTQICWSFADRNSPDCRPREELLTEHQQFNNLGNKIENVTVIQSTPAETDTDVMNFSVLVVNVLDDETGAIGISVNDQYHPYYPVSYGGNVPANKSLIISANIPSNLQGLHPTYEWKLGDNTKPVIYNNAFSYTYTKSGNYLVSCTLNFPYSGDSLNLHRLIHVK